MTDEERKLRNALAFILGTTEGLKGLPPAEYPNTFNKSVDSIHQKAVEALGYQEPPK